MYRQIECNKRYVLLSFGNKDDVDDDDDDDDDDNDDDDYYNYSFQHGCTLV